MLKRVVQGARTFWSAHGLLIVAAFACVFILVVLTLEALNPNLSRTVRAFNPRFRWVALSIDFGIGLCVLIGATRMVLDELSGLGRTVRSTGHCGLDRSPCVIACVLGTGRPAISLWIEPEGEEPRGRHVQVALVESTSKRQLHGQRLLLTSTADSGVLTHKFASARRRKFDIIASLDDEHLPEVLPVIWRLEVRGGSATITST